MSKNSIGIIGGAGPLAGAILFEKIITLLNKEYGFSKDSDFPKIFLLSFPFSDMLSPNLDAALIRAELMECLSHLRENGASTLVIACNTLHAFLNEEDLLDDLVHLPKEVAKVLPIKEKPLVLCTSSSARFKLHQRFFPCSYPDSSTQEAVDILIDLILKGEKRSLLIDKLEKLLEHQISFTIVLGCTELSIIAPFLRQDKKLIIDPLEIVANKIIKKIFK